jgi:hypothetical protein
LEVFFSTSFVGGHFLSVFWSPICLSLTPLLSP